ncbi:hypothetical protein GTU99_07355 [Streptomyces sp. PRKS01-65]|nr:hypothetical protein [Streptomyces harenosi]NEY32016.1 hypothetical protein [Streptomyces harenosi]
MTNPQQTDPAPAVRLIFEYEGDSVRLVSQQPVDTAVSSFETDATTRPGDYVVETRDDYGKRLARVPAREAFRGSAEVFPEDQKEPITRVDVEARGAFTVIVPAPAEAVQVAVVHVDPPEREPRSEDIIGPPAEVRQDVDLATFQLER